MKQKTVLVILGAILLGTLGAGAQPPAPPLDPKGEVFDDVEGLLQRVAWASPVYSVDWSPDGANLATGSGHGVVRLWDSFTGREDRRFRDPQGSGSVRDVAFSPDGTKLVATSEDGIVRLWDLETPDKPLERYRGWSVTWGPQDRFLAIGLRDGTIRIRDFQEGTDLPASDRHDARVATLAWSTRGQYGQLASGSWDGTIRTWNGRDGTLVHLLEGHEEQVNGVSWDSAGERLASASSDGTVRIWDAESGREVRQFEVLDAAVYAVAWAYDGEIIVAASSDRSLRAWKVDRKTAAEIGRFHGHRGDVYSVALSPGGERLASSSADGTARIWATASNQEVMTLQGHAARVLALGLSHDGETLAVGSEDEMIRVWDLRRDGTGPVQISHGEDKVLYALAVSPDGRTVVAGFNDGTLEIWEDGEIVPPLKGSGSVFALAFNPDGTRLAAASDRTISIVEIDRWKIGAEIESPQSPTTLVWSPDGQTLAVGTGDGRARLWSMETRELIKSLDRQLQPIESLAFPGNDEVRILLRNRTVYDWNTTTADPRQVSRLGEQVVPAVLSADGQRLASVRVSERVVRIAQRRGGSYDVTRRILGGARGTWVRCSSDRCWRHDDGTLFLQEDAQQRLAGLPPPSSTGANLKLLNLPDELQIDDGEAAILNLKIHNEGRPPIYWLAAYQAQVDSPLIFHPSPPLAVLSPGEIGELPCRISFRTDLVNPTSMERDLELVIVTAHSRMNVTLPVAVRVPSLEWNEIEVQGQRRVSLTVTNTGAQDLPRTTLHARFSNDSAAQGFIDELPAGEKKRVSLAIPEDVGSNIEVGVVLVAETLEHPYHRWNSSERRLFLPRSRLVPNIFLFILTVVGIALVFYVLFLRRRRIVLKQLEGTGVPVRVTEAEGPSEEDIQNLRDDVRKIVQSAGLIFINSIDVRAVKCIKEASLRFSRGESFAGPGWYVLAGDNGSGKSTLLRSIAAVSTGKNASDLFLDSAWVRDGYEDGSVHVGYRCQHDDSGSMFKSGIEFKQSDKLFIIDDDSRAILDNAFVAAYGPFKRLTGESTVAKRFADADSKRSRIITLFLEEAALSKVSEWLLTISHTAEGKFLEKDIVELLNSGLIPEKFKVEGVKFDDIELTTLDGARIPLESASDGVRCMVGIVLDVLRGMEDCHGALDLSGGIVRNPGVVLIDEPDNHLHVLWQVGLATWMKKHFPRVQFIIASHSPFMCIGADKIWRLDDKQGTIAPRELPREEMQEIWNGSVATILESDAFRVFSTLSPRTLDRHVEYLKLKDLALEVGLDAEQQMRLKELEEEIVGPI